LGLQFEADPPFAAAHAAQALSASDSAAADPDIELIVGLQS
jgi:hypothetical protein